MAYLTSVLLALVVHYWVFERQIHPLRLGRPRQWRKFAKGALPVGLGTLFHTVSVRLGVALVTLLAGPSDP
ncbi:hypothetical protein MYX77_14195, partial [Acidobacteriia bacterium AH_259_A11_L15]|nr:hypothetical protein [Acidobacteriia bacterium AH_259_A11_L15]